MKRCATCLQEKPFEAFNIERARCDGRQAACRECMRAYHKTRRRNYNSVVIRKHRTKYQNHEYVRTCGVLVRKLSEREIREFRQGVAEIAPQAIRLEVNA